MDDLRAVGTPSGGVWRVVRRGTPGARVILVMLAAVSTMLTAVSTGMLPVSAERRVRTSGALRVTQSPYTQSYTQPYTQGSNTAGRAVRVNHARVNHARGPSAGCPGQAPRLAPAASHDGHLDTHRPGTALPAAAVPAPRPDTCRAPAMAEASRPARAPLGLPVGRGPPALADS